MPLETSFSNKTFYSSKAIKQINYAKINLDREQVENEAQVMTTLEHRFIVKYFDDFVIDFYFHIVTEYCEVSLPTGFYITLY